MGNRNPSNKQFSKGPDHVTASRMTKKQLNLMITLANPANYGIKMSEVAKRAGCSRNYIYHMLLQDWFLDELNKRVDRAIDGHIYELYQASFRKAITPNGFQDRKLLFEMYGKYSQSVNVNDVTPAFIDDVPEEDDDDETD